MPPRRIRRDHAYTKPVPAFDEAAGELREAIRARSRAPRRSGSAALPDSTGQFHKEVRRRAASCRLLHDGPADVDFRRPVHVHDAEARSRRSRTCARCASWAAGGARQACRRGSRERIARSDRDDQGAKVTQIGFVGLARWAETWCAAYAATPSTRSWRSTSTRRPSKRAAKRRVRRGQPQGPGQAAAGAAHGVGSWSPPARRRSRRWTARQAARARDMIVDGATRAGSDDKRRAGQAEDAGHRLRRRGVSGGVWGLEVATDDGRRPTERSGDWLRSSTCSPAETTSRAVRLSARALAALRGIRCRALVKMVHNGVEYGLMQAYAGLRRCSTSAVRARQRKIAHSGDRVGRRSWLCELAAAPFEPTATAGKDRGLHRGLGEGRWTIEDAPPMTCRRRDHGLALRAAALARERRLRRSRARGVRNQFGGHAVKTAPTEDARRLTWPSPPASRPPSPSPRTR